MLAVYFFSVNHGYVETFLYDTTRRFFGFSIQIQIIVSVRVRKAYQLAGSQMGLEYPTKPTPYCLFHSLVSYSDGPGSTSIKMLWEQHQVQYQRVCLTLQYSIFSDAVLTLCVLSGQSGKVVQLT